MLKWLEVVSDNFKGWVLNNGTNDAENSLSYKFKAKKEKSMIILDKITFEME